MNICHALANGLRLFLLTAALFGLSGCADGVSTGGCESSTDCARGATCQSAVCVGGPGCTENTQCSPSTTCQNGACAVQECETSDVCGAQRICLDSRCALRPGDYCTADADCETTCDVQSNRCVLAVEGCGEGPPCPANERCEAGECLAPRCADDTACRAGTWCQDDGRCVPGCREGQQTCGQGRVCDPQSHTCRDEGRCNDDADCAAAEYCTLGATCAPGCRLEPDSCDMGQGCDPEQRRCLAVCAQDDDCAADRYCGASNRCQIGCRLEVDACGANFECEADHRCACRDDAACPGGFCQEGECLPGCRAEPESCGEGGRCDVEAGDCRCIEDSFCAQEQYCGSDGCVAGCRVGGCGDGAICELSSRSCTPVDGPCDDDTGCIDGQFCREGSCADGCRIGSCGNGRACDLASRICSCALDVGCPDGAYCDAGACLPGCRIEPDSCPAGTCDAESRACGCVEDVDCPDGAFCDGGLCAPGCRPEPDTCGPARTCDPERRECLCADDSGCPGGTFCSDGACQNGCRLAPDNCGADRRCEPESRTCGCLTDAACGAEQYCAEGLCVDGCRLGEGCAEGQRCDPESRRCSCANDEDCDAEAYCGGGACTVGCRLAPDNCGVLALCDPVGRICAAPVCQRDADCARGLVCGLDDALVLRCGQPVGQGRAEAPCERALECAVPICVNGTHCFSACGADGDCPSDRCVTITVTGAGVEAEVQTCRPPVAACAADAECGERQICLAQGTVEGQPNRVQLSCAGRPEQGGVLGAACEAGADCQSSNCVGGRCWGPCRVGEADCPDGLRCYEDALFFRFDQGTVDPADDRFDGLSACEVDEGSHAPCAGGCPAGESCGLIANRDNTAFEHICRTNVGDRRPGAACDNDAQCQTGSCINDSFCFGVCEVPEICAAGACVELNLTVWDRDTPDRADDVTDAVPICAL